MGPRGYKKEPEAKVGSSFEITDSVESRDAAPGYEVKTKYPNRYRHNYTRSNGFRAA